nr:retrotransposon protein, putative, Ty3-gypsy subclass [Tanacetum cinerariifolium]
ASLRIEPDLISRIKEAQKEDNEIWTIGENLDKQVEFRIDEDNVLWQDTRLVVPNDASLREALLTEAHSFPFSVHPGSTKMCHDLKQHFWWCGMKRDVATFVSRCLICQQVKSRFGFSSSFHMYLIFWKLEHQRASGLLQPLNIPVWKWDEISMDFQEIVRLHGTPSAIVSDREPRFTSRFWKGLQKAWGTRLKFSTAFHPQTDGQSERTIQTLEDMLRSCALEWTGNWDDYICLVEFAYNNSWHVEKLKEARTRQKSYADKHRRSLEFQPGDHVFLKVSPARGVRCFGIKGKLSPRFIRPFEILDRVGEVSYRLALPPQLSHVHNVFHVSLLRGYKYHPIHVISYPLNQIRTDLSYVEEPKDILDRQDRVIRKKTIPFVKILWRNHPEREATWETEEFIRTSYPHFLS